MANVDRDTLAASASAAIVHGAAGSACSRRSASPTTEDDLAFLRRPLYGFLSVAAGPQPPQPRPVWFEATDRGTVELFTGPDTVKIRRLRRDPRASLVVAAPVGERERWTSIAGHTEVATDGAHELAARLAARYWDLADPTRAADLADLLAYDQVRLIIHPDSVNRYAMG